MRYAAEDAFQIGKRHGCDGIVIIRRRAGAGPAGAWRQSIVARYRGSIARLLANDL